MKAKPAALSVIFWILGAVGAWNFPLSIHRVFWAIEFACVAMTDKNQRPSLGFHRYN